MPPSVFFWKVCRSGKSDGQQGSSAYLYFTAFAFVYTLQNAVERCRNARMLL